MTVVLSTIGCAGHNATMLMATAIRMVFCMLVAVYLTYTAPAFYGVHPSTIQKNHEVD
jgi:hypothetical protein